MRATVGIVCAAFACLVAACTIQPGDDSSSSGSGGGGTVTGTETVGDQCDAINAEFCNDTSTQCGIMQNVQQCVDNDRASCCVGSACDATATVSDSTVSSCEEALDGLTCYELTEISNAGACLTTGSFQ